MTNSERKCPICNDYFSSDAALKEHLKRIPWWRFAKRKPRSGKIQCEFCKKDFYSEREFSLHWDENHDSMVEEKRYLFPRQRETKDWTIRPMEDELVKHNLRSDSAYAALKNDFTVNEIVMNEINHGIEQEAMTVIEIVGIPGVGKSLFALSLARIIQIKWLDYIVDRFKHGILKEAYAPKIYIGFDLETTLRYLKSARKGDIVIQDEDPEMMGAHSNSSKQQIENVMKIMRKACINFIFVSPISTPYINMPNMVFEVVAKQKKKRLTKAALYDRKYHAVGWTVMKIIEPDDELLIAYDNMKDVNLERIKQSGGRRSIGIAEDQVLDDMRKLLTYLKKINYNFTKRHSLADLIEYAGMAQVEGDSLYQRLIAKQVQEFMEENISALLEEDLSDSMDIRGKYLIEKEAEYDDVSFLEVMYNSVDEALDAIKSRSKKDPRENPLKYFQTHHAKAWFNYYFHGLSYDSIGNIFGISGQAIANTYENGGYNAIFQEEIQGECAEIALQKKYFRDYKNVGGFGRPDLVLEANPDGDWIESKCFARLAERLENLIAKFEYEFIDKGGTMRLALITYKKKSCKIKIYKVSLNPQYKSVEEIKSELHDLNDVDVENIEDEFDSFEFGEDL